MIEKICKAVEALLENEATGHDFDHTRRVWKTAEKLSENLSVDKDVVAIAALLHDCDDYKIFGKEASENLANARRILAENGVGEEKSRRITDIIKNLGYSKYLDGSQDLSAEGVVVADADMLDSCGVMGIIRTLLFNAKKGSGKFFDKEIFPRKNMSKEVYQNKTRSEETAINHFFEKLLLLKNIMYTPAGRAEAERRHMFMVEFLREYFRELDLPQWSAYLEDFVNSENHNKG